MLLKKINPDAFHGENKKQNFFEGWYYKFVDKERKNVYSFIPGISLGKDATSSHSFIQVLCGSLPDFFYEKYKVNAFKGYKNKFEFSIDDNGFSGEHVSLNINTPTISVNGKVSFSNIKKWQDSIINPGSMGFYNYFNFMQCYSQVCAMDMELNGRLCINGKIIDFSGGKGYIEKNWGKAFPYSWIWIQSNCFSNNAAALTCSIGHVPFISGSFKGFLIGLYIDDNFYTFSTINRSKLHIEMKSPDVIINVISSKYTLSLTTRHDKKKFMLLYGPREGKMIPLVNENLLGEVDVILKDNINNNIIFSDTGVCTGIEYGGEQKYIVNGK